MFGLIFFDPEIIISFVSGFPARWSAVNEPGLYEERLIHVLYRIRFLAHSNAYGLDPDRTAKLIL